MPPRADLSFAGLDNYVFKSKVSETITNVLKIESNASKTSKNSLEKPKTVRSSAPFIEEWESDSEDENVLSLKKRVWDNTARVNYQNKLTHPHPKRNFVPAAVSTKSRQVPVNTAKQSSHRAATSARPLLKDRKKSVKLVDPLLQGRYSIRSVHDVVVVTAMCLQEQANSRHLIGDIVVALKYLAS
nr:probable serine/threonine-protein kinase PBL21 [Tanacetum cinerariifolium]